MAATDDNCDIHESSMQKCSCRGLAKPKHLGNLLLWFRLTCELENLKKFASKIWTNNTIGHLRRIVETADGKPSHGNESTVGDTTDDTSRRTEPKVPKGDQAEVIEVGGLSNGIFEPLLDHYYHDFFLRNLMHH